MSNVLKCSKSKFRNILRNEFSIPVSALKDCSYQKVSADMSTLRFLVGDDNECKAVINICFGRIYVRINSFIGSSSEKEDFQYLTFDQIREYELVKEDVA